MKSKSRRFAEHATEFIGQLLSMDAPIGLVTWRASDAFNAELSKKKHAKEEEARARLRVTDPNASTGTRPVSEYVRNYGDMLFRAISECMKAIINLQRSLPQFLSIRADREEIGEHRCDMKRDAETKLAKLGIVGDIDWLSRKQDALLLVPDLVAGTIAHSQEPEDWNRDLLPASDLLLLRGIREGRVCQQNQVPSHTEQARSD